MGSSTAIGSASVVLTANADGLAGGLDSAAKHLDKWAKDVEGKHASSGGGGLFGKILGGAGGLAGGLAGLAGSAAGMAFGVSKEFITDSIKQIKELAAVGRQADAIGVA